MLVRYEEIVTKAAREGGAIMWDDSRNDAFTGSVYELTVHLFQLQGQFAPCPAAVIPHLRRSHLVGVAPQPLGFPEQELLGEVCKLR